jgi:hypothetical protein
MSEARHFGTHEVLNNISEADLKPADILSFLPQFPTDQDLNPHQE